jgi:hypothetical protein
MNLQVEFSDFLEPTLIKTGHVIPLTCGHNGPFNKVELSIYELHLTNAGFIQDPEIIMEMQDDDADTEEYEDPKSYEEGLYEGSKMDVHFLENDDEELQQVPSRTVTTDDLIDVNTINFIDYNMEEETTQIQ